MDTEPGNNRWPPTSSPAGRAWQRAMDGMIDGDRDRVRSAFAEDAEWYDPFSGSIHGSIAIADHVGGMKGRDFDSTEVEVAAAMGDGDDCAIEWTQRLLTGSKVLELKGVTVLSVVDGQITRMCDYIHPVGRHT